MKTNRKVYISLLSIISAIAVVFLHTNGCFWAFSKSRYWFTANIIECVFFFAVPIFFMITGVNLIDYQKKYSTKEYFKKRIKKAFIPFIIWSLIGLLYSLIQKYISINDLSIKYIIDGIMNSKIVSIYWFFPPLFGVYLVLPLFASIKDEKKDKIFLYLIILYLIIDVLIPFIIGVFHIDLQIPISIFVLSGYFVYVLIGYLLDKYELKLKYRVLIYISAILGLIAHIVGTYVLSMKASAIDYTFKGYTNLPSILYSIGIFIFVKQISKKIPNLKIIDFVSRYTFPIYLMHWFVIDIGLSIFGFNTLSIIYRLGYPLIIIPICIGVAFIFRKIPLIKKIVP